MTYASDDRRQHEPERPNQRINPQNGGTVRLTIDQNLQYMAQQLPRRRRRPSGARGGQMAILDARTAQVLGLASSGTFDAADPNTDPDQHAADPPVMSVFEPGSVQKVDHVRGRARARPDHPAATVTVPDKIRMGGVTVSDAWWHPTEKFTATGILAESSNVGTLKIAQQLGPAAWDRYESSSASGPATGIELPGESSRLPAADEGLVGLDLRQPAVRPGREHDRAAARVDLPDDRERRGARRRRASSSRSPARTARPRPRQPAGVRVVEPRTAQTVRTMLESVTQPGGTGVKAAIPGYRVAGKTGTAQQPDPSTRRRVLELDELGHVRRAWSRPTTRSSSSRSWSTTRLTGSRAATSRRRCSTRSRATSCSTRTSRRPVRCPSTCRCRCATRRHRSLYAQYPLLTCRLLAGVPRPAPADPRRASRPGGARQARRPGRLVGADLSRSPASPRPAAQVRAGRPVRRASPAGPGTGLGSRPTRCGAARSAVLTDVAGAALLPAGVPTVARGRRAGAARRGRGRRLRRAERRRCDVLGVTGTSGKTTTTFLIRAGLLAAGRVPGADRHGRDADRRRR